MSALAFHEKSGRCQGILWLGKFISMFSFVRICVSFGWSVTARFSGRRKTRVFSFRELSSADYFCRHPSIRTLM